MARMTKAHTSPSTAKSVLGTHAILAAIYHRPHHAACADHSAPAMDLRATQGHRCRWLLPGSSAGGCGAVRAAALAVALSTPTLRLTLLPAAPRRAHRALDLLFESHNYLKSLDAANNLLRVLIGIADYFVSIEHGNYGLGDKLCLQLIRIVFDSWLRLQQRFQLPVELCQAFLTHCQRWTHRVEFVQEWGRVTKGLTTELVWVMSGHRGEHRARQGSDTRRAGGQAGGAHMVFLSDTNVARNLHRFLSLMGNPATPGVAPAEESHLRALSRNASSAAEPNPVGMREEVFLGMTAAMSEMVNIFLQGLVKFPAHARDQPPWPLFLVGPSLPPFAQIRLLAAWCLVAAKCGKELAADRTGRLGNRQKAHSLIFINLAALTVGTPHADPPSSNSILTIFGEWLQRAAGREISAANRKGGSALAIGALCRIFCAPQLTAVFSPADLKPFYYIIAQAVRGEVTGAAVLDNAAKIFTRELSGSAVLFECMFPLLQKTLTHGVSLETSAKPFVYENASPVMQVRLKIKAAQILNTMVCVPFVYARQLNAQTEGGAPVRCSHLSPCASPALHLLRVSCLHTPVTTTVTTTSSYCYVLFVHGVVCLLGSVGATPRNVVRCARIVTDMCASISFFVQVISAQSICHTCVFGLHANWTDETSQVLMNTLLSLTLLCQCYGVDAADIDPADVAVQVCKREPSRAKASLSLPALLFV